MSDDSEQEGAIIADTGGVHTISYISNTHLKSADFFVQQASDIERQYPDRDSLLDSGSMSQNSYKSYCTSAIINSMAFLEATINEICSRMIYIGEQSYPGIKDERFWQAMNHSTVVEKLFGKHPSTIEKYNNMLSMLDKNKISTGEDPGQSVKCVTDLRNAFIHFEPKSVRVVGKRETDGEYGFETGMRNRFDLNPYTGDGNPFFPDQCQSRGCAEWSVKKTLAFAGEFFERLGVDRPYEPMLDYIEVTPS